MKTDQLTAPLLGGALSLFVVIPALADASQTGEPLSTDVKRLEVRTESCEAMGLAFESRLSELAARLADAAEAGDQRSDSQREEIEQTKIEIAALDDCATDLESFRDDVAARLGERPEGVEQSDGAAEDNESLASLHLRHDIITGRIERLRTMAGEIRDSLMPSINRADLEDD